MVCPQVGFIQITALAVVPSNSIFLLESVEALLRVGTKVVFLIDISHRPPTPATPWNHGLRFDTISILRRRTRIELEVEQSSYWTVPHGAAAP